MSWIFLPLDGSVISVISYQLSVISTSNENREVSCSRLFHLQDLRKTRNHTPYVGANGIRPLEVAYYLGVCVSPDLKCCNRCRLG